MNLVLLLAADFATVDASQKLNILGVFNTIYAQHFPAKHPSMHLIIKIQPASGEIGETRELRIILVDEDGVQLAEAKGDFSIPKGKPGKRPEFNAVLGFQGLEFPRPGTYEFRVFIDKEQKGELPLDVLLIEPPTEPQ